jgi:hypothetical protein
MAFFFGATWFPTDSRCKQDVTARGRVESERWYYAREKPDGERAVGDDLLSGHPMVNGVWSRLDMPPGTPVVSTVSKVLSSESDQSSDAHKHGQSLAGTPKMEDIPVWQVSRCRQALIDLAR